MARHLRAVLVTRGQHEQQVLDLGDAELRELVGQCRPDTAQRRDRSLLVHDMWRGIDASARTCGYPRCSVHSISTRALRGNAATATVERAG